MSSGAYYNEFEPFAAQWLRNLIAAGHIPAGDVDDRSIADVRPDDLAGYRQCHFFAGLGGWAYAARLAGWPDDRELWTGSAPCQPFSTAGKGKAQADDRHLWPHLFRLTSARRPAVLMGEQVAAAVGKDWLDGVCADLESIGYACGAAVVPACAVNAPHRRDRLWFVADAHHAGLEGFGGHELRAAQGRGEPAGPAAAAGLLDCAEYAGGAVGDAAGLRRIERREGPGAPVQGERAERGGEYPRPEQIGQLAGRPEGLGDGGAVADPSRVGEREQDHEDSTVTVGRQTRPVPVQRGHWDAASWLIGHDGKARRVESDFRRVVDGLSESLGRLCSDFYAEAAEGVIGYATAAQCGPDEVLRAVRDAAAAQEVWQEPRGFHGIREAEILLPYLRELEGRLNEGWIPGAVAEAEGQVMRGVRLPSRSARAPQGRGLHEQLAGQYPDTLHTLSWVLARAARQALEALLSDAPIVPLLANGVPARVGKLRAYGNAIVPQIAAEVIGAWMECRP